MILKNMGIFAAANERDTAFGVLVFYGGNGGGNLDKVACGACFNDGDFHQYNAKKPEL